MSDWDTYIHQILNCYNYDTNTVKRANMAVAAGIYGKDGNCWAASKEFPELWTYDFVVEGMCASENVTVHVDEVQVCVLAADGERKPAGDAGIRIANTKYMFVTYDDITETT